MVEKNKIYHGNNLDILKTFEDNSIDSIVTDPPYGISFMNKKWDYDVPSVEFWNEALRVLKPGGHALVACGTRTQHRMAVNLEDAGFEIRDIVAWVYGSGFPKSHDISKALDKMMGAEREIIGKAKGVGNNNTNSMKNGLGGSQEFASEYDLTKPSTEQAKQWQGWGTALKPAMELWTLCRKPLDGTVAQNVLKYGVGGINIDGCRVEFEDTKNPATNPKYRYENNYKVPKGGVESNGVIKFTSSKNEINVSGRFPANFIHDGSEEVLALFPNTGNGNGGDVFNYSGKEYNNKDTSMFNGDKPQAPSNYNDSGSAARFFYTSKSSKFERNIGETNNIHPTVKPIDLMRYLVRLITPKNGICLDPYLGSGTTAVACKMEGFNYVGCELDEEYVKIAEARINAVKDYDTNVDTKIAIQESQKEKKEQELGIMNIFDFLGDE